MEDITKYLNNYTPQEKKTDKPTKKEVEMIKIQRLFKLVMLKIMKLIKKITLNGIHLGLSNIHGYIVKKEMEKKLCFVKYAKMQIVLVCGQLLVWSG
ncbi:hypothetical protein RIR_jg32998.t1 [Rhizophagus irregularis DAOM 181602=DAOM 197198]|nr:hypothetical protein RIR_jg32998.t1 [Rhizophagus irregularis DAOM 181602=DAOM 197198]